MFDDFVYTGTDYLGRKKPFDEFLFELSQDSFERKLSGMVKKKEKKKAKEDRLLDTMHKDYKSSGFYKRNKKKTRRR